MVYDWITEDAQRRFGESPEVHVSLKRRFLTLTFGDGKAVLRFKKYRGRRLRTGGIPTQQRLEFQYQWQALDGMELTNLVAGYLLDATEMEQAVIAVTCPMGDEVIWRIDLDGGEGIEPTVPIAPSDDRDGPIIRSSIRKDEDTRNSQKE